MKDVIIIGGGIVGCATARFLSRYKLQVLVLERETDIGTGATKANSGILHAGYDCHQGTLKAALNVKGVEMYPRLARELDIPYRINGSMVLSYHQDGVEDWELKKLYARGGINGVSGLKILSGEDARKLEPNLNRSVTAVLRAETAGVISPYEAAIAFGENAVQNGVGFSLDTTVIGISRGEGYIVSTNRGNFCAKVVVNAAGVESGHVYNMARHNMDCFHEEEILPQRGEYYLLDNTQRDLVKHTIFQLPTHLGKGVLIVPTVDNNIMLGPTADFIEDGNDTSTTRKGLADILEKVALSLNQVPIRDRIANFAGVRAKHESKDFVLEEPQPGFINAIGIDSPGLSAAPAIAAYLAEIVLSRLQPAENPDFNPHREGIKRFRELLPERQEYLVRKNPDYGRIVCRCETITEAEVIQAIHRPIGAKNLDALKRRTRAQMGRCQGGFCTIRLIEILSRELGVPETAVTKGGAGSEIVMGMM